MPRSAQNTCSVFASLVKSLRLQKQRLWQLITLVLLLISTNNAHAKSSTLNLRIAVAANFSPILAKFTAGFELQHGITIDLISGSTGGLYQQILNGAPFDLYLAADSIRPQLLLSAGIAENLQTYAIGELALWSPLTKITSLAPLITLAEHTNDSAQRLAIANPKIAPYGEAAQQVLTQLNLWQALQKRLILGVNINQTFLQVRSGAAPLGIVAKSQLALNNLDGFTMPQEFYTPIKQQLVIVSKSEKKQQAKLFIAYLLSIEVQSQLAALGYLPLADFNSQKIKEDDV
ncbi:MAG: molybdate ABC transporter substrate-binding protein [Thalassotalea sp.]